MKVSTIISLSLVALSFIACSKKGGSSAAAATTYYISNGLCYNSSNTQVDYNNCSTTYYTSNGLCYNSSNVQVNTSYCSTTSGGYYINGSSCYNSSNVQVAYSYCTGNNGSSSSCVGLYYYVDYYGQLWKVNCDGIANYGNCSGYQLIQGNTGNYTYCN